ncbi:unnamed protein product, partial [Prorocentrum cordatum]
RGGPCVSTARGCQGCRFFAPAPAAPHQARRRELVRRSRRNGRPPAAGAAARSSAMGASVGWAREVRSEGDPRIGEAKLVRRGPRLAVPPALSPRGEAAPPSPPSPRFVLACCRAAHGRRRDPDSRAPRK